MSFYQQERVLFDLLFDRALREAFCRDGVAALADYALSDQEKNDFTKVRPDALMMDADMRCRLVLAQLCKAYPLSFSLVSSLEHGVDMLKAQINSALMQAPPAERQALFGRQLQQALDGNSDAGAMLAVIAAETAMAFAAARLRHDQLAGIGNAWPALADDWVSRPLDLADYVASAPLPDSYGFLQRSLCPVPGAGLWQHLQSHPLPASVRQSVLANGEPRLLLARAVVREASGCDPQVDFVTAELSAGFAPIFQHVNGSMTAMELLAHLQHAGADAGLLATVQRQLHQLLQTGMLVVR
ncbi:MAG TPA: hypothetical protein VIN71_08775 [Pseudomonadales bacterium]